MALEYLALTRVLVELVFTGESSSWSVLMALEWSLNALPRRMFVRLCCKRSN